MLSRNNSHAPSIPAIVAMQPPAVLALKALWQDFPAISANSLLAGKLAAIAAAKAGASPIEAAYVGQGYTLPEGVTWQEVATQRARYDIAPQRVPVAEAPGCSLWSVPEVKGRYLLHPGNAGEGAPK
jgi:hypothetical protein